LTGDGCAAQGHCGRTSLADERQGESDGREEAKFIHCLIPFCVSFKVPLRLPICGFAAGFERPSGFCKLLKRKHISLNEIE
jgi:hypothetical protein